MTESFYDLLGVSRDAETEEIERAYRRRVKETHPDVNDDADASERTARLVEARDVLVDDVERARYDRLGHETYVTDGADVAEGRERSGPASGAASSGARGTGPSNARASAEERRRRERRAREDVGFGFSSTASNGRSHGGHRATREAGAAAASGTAGGATATGTAGGTGATGTTGATSEPPPWSDTADGWAARTPPTPSPGLTARVVHAFRRSPAMVTATVVVYPLLVFGTVFPAFPLYVNVVVCACLVALIAATQSVPGLGIAVFGWWATFGSGGLVVAGLSPISPVGLIVLGSTWLPLGLSVLTYTVLVR